MALQEILDRMVAKRPEKRFAVPSRSGSSCEAFCGWLRSACFAVCR